MPAKKAKWSTVPDPNYAYTKKLSADGWAWEFLRRTEEYRTAYKEFIANIDAPPFHYSPPKLDGETDTTWKRRVLFKGQGDPEKLSRERHAARTFQLAGMYEPNLKYAASKIRFLPHEAGPFLATVTDDLEPFVSSEARDVGIDAFQPGFCVLVFDLTASIDHQKNQAAKILKLRRQKYQLTPARALKFSSNWNDYLRVLDLSGDGATVAEIGEKLWPNTPTPDHVAADHAKDFLEQARFHRARWREVRRVKVTE
jgi:hypothetical protein